MENVFYIFSHNESLKEYFIKNIQLEENLKHLSIHDDKLIGVSNNMEVFEFNSTSAESYNIKPKYLFYNIKIKKICLNSTFSIAIDESGFCLSWGICEEGQLGHGHDVKNIKEPMIIKGIFNIADISISNHHCVALTHNGNVYTWGSGKYGELGQNKRIYSPVPSEIDNDNNYLYINAHDYITCLIDNNKKISYFGVIFNKKPKNKIEQIKRLSSMENIFEEKSFSELSDENISSCQMGSGYLSILTEKGIVFVVDDENNLTLLFSENPISSISTSNEKIIGITKKSTLFNEVTMSNQIKPQFYMTIWEKDKEKEINEKELSIQQWICNVYSMQFFREANNEKNYIIEVIESSKENVFILKQTYINQNNAKRSLKQEIYSPNLKKVCFNLNQKDIQLEQSSEENSNSQSINMSSNNLNIKDIKLNSKKYRMSISYNSINRFKDENVNYSQNLNGDNQFDDKKGSIKIVFFKFYDSTYNILYKSNESYIVRNKNIPKQLQQQNHPQQRLSYIGNKASPNNMTYHQNISNNLLSSSIMNKSALIESIYDDDKQEKYDKTVFDQYNLMKREFSNNKFLVDSFFSPKKISKKESILDNSILSINKKGSILKFNYNPTRLNSIKLFLSTLNIILKRILDRNGRMLIKDAFLNIKIYRKAFYFDSFRESYRGSFLIFKKKIQIGFIKKLVLINKIRKICGIKRILYGRNFKYWSILKNYMIKKYNYILGFKIILSTFKFLIRKYTFFMYKSLLKHLNLMKKYEKAVPLLVKKLYNALLWNHRMYIKYFLKTMHENKNKKPKLYKKVSINEFNNKSILSEMKSKIKEESYSVNNILLFISLINSVLKKNLIIKNSKIKEMIHSKKISSKYIYHKSQFHINLTESSIDNNTNNIIKYNKTRFSNKHEKKSNTMNKYNKQESNNTLKLILIENENDENEKRKSEKLFNKLNKILSKDDIFYTNNTHNSNNTVISVDSNSIHNNKEHFKDRINTNLITDHENKSTPFRNKKSNQNLKEQLIEKLSQSNSQSQFISQFNTPIPIQFLTNSLINSKCEGCIENSKYLKTLMNRVNLLRTDVDNLIVNSNIHTENNETIKSYHTYTKKIIKKNNSYDLTLLIRRMSKMVICIRKYLYKKILTRLKLFNFKLNKKRVGLKFMNKVFLRRKFFYYLKFYKKLVKINKIIKLKLLEN